MLGMYVGLMFQVHWGGGGLQRVGVEEKLEEAS